MKVLNLQLDHELKALQALSDNLGLGFCRLDDHKFTLNFHISENLSFHLLVECDEYPLKPPAWHWHAPETGELDPSGRSPMVGGYFHSQGVICAPWNSLAYQQVNPGKGPHGDWNLAGWKSNPYTGGCRTLDAMVLKLYVEFKCSFPEGRAA